MNANVIALFAGAVGLLMGFTLGQFFNLSLVTWKGKPIIRVGKRTRTRKLPWMKVFASFMLLAILYTVVSFSLFQTEQADCNAEQRRVSQERGKAATDDSKLLQQDSINLGVAIRTLLNQPQPTSNETINEAVSAQNAFIAEVTKQNPQMSVTEAALIWYQQEQLKTIEVREKNDAIRRANPYPEARCENV